MKNYLNLCLLTSFIFLLLSCSETTNEPQKADYYRFSEYEKGHII